MAEIRGVSSFYSNINIEEVVKKLMEIERRPVERMKERTKDLTNVKNEWSSLKTELISLKSLAYTIKQISFWNQKIGVSSDENILKIRVSANALPASYNITINSLATYSRREGGNDIGRPIDPDALLNKAGYKGEITYGYFTINGVPIEVTETDTTNTILDKIETQISGMSATYDSANDKIVLSYNGSIVIGSSTDTSNFLQMVKLSSGTNQIESSSKLGVVSLTEKLENARLNINLSSQTGSFKINGTEISYDIKVDTLQTILTKINSSSSGVYAYYDPYEDRVVLVSKETGSTGIFVEDVSGNLMSALKLTSSANLILGQDAKYIVEGFNNNQTITSKSNYNIEIARGVYGDFLNTGSVNVKINMDVDEIVSEIKNFIEKYNSVFNTLREKNKIEIKGNTVEKGILGGDALLRDVIFNLRNKMGSIRSNLEEGFNNLSNFGIITSDIKGTYYIKDETILRSKIIENPEETIKFFRVLMDDLYSYLESQTKEGWGIYGGRISNRMKTIDDEIARLNKNIKTYEERLKLTEERYWSQFIAMEQLISHWQSQISYLLGQNINEKR